LDGIDATTSSHDNLRSNHSDQSNQSDPSSNHAATDSLALDFFRYTPIFTLILNASLVIVQVSDSYLQVLGGCSRERALGLHVDDFFAKTAPVPPLASARKAIRAAQETRRPYELKHLNTDGTAWTIRIVPIIQHGCLRYLQMELKDITQEHQKQLELEERLYTNETFRILVETVKDYAIFMLNPTGHIATWNAGAERFKGYKRDEIVGKHFSNFYSQEDRDNDKPGRELADALRDGRVEDEGWRYRKDGSRFWYRNPATVKPRPC
jgi:osomolarity two-component system sensor histidine kinase TcsA